jgi:hypothetical protein
MDHPDEKLKRLYRWLEWTIILMYLGGALFYADPFHFWQHALSEIGTTRTLLGTPNLASSLIVTTGLFIIGRLLLEVARVYRNNKVYSKRIIKSNLAYCASLGAFISISPNDLLHSIHTFGSATLIGGTFLLTMIMIWDYQDHYGSNKAYLVMAVLTISVIAYAITYFSGLEIKQAVQKICLINMLLTIYQRTRISLNIKSMDLKHHQV